MGGQAPDPCSLGTINLFLLLKHANILIPMVPCCVHAVQWVLLHSCKSGLLQIELHGGLHVPSSPLNAFLEASGVYFDDALDLGGVQLLDEVIGALLP